MSLKCLISGGELKANPYDIRILLVHSEQAFHLPIFKPTDQLYAGSHPSALNWKLH